MTNETNPIFDLILAERVRQTEKWGKQNRKLAVWLLIIQEEMGEVAKAFLEFKQPEEWAGPAALTAAHSDLITEAVQVTAVAVQIGEWLSELSGWPATSEEVIKFSMRGYKYSPGDPLESYAKLTEEVGMIAAGVSKSVTTTVGRESSYVRRMVFYGCELIYRLQQKGGRAI